MPLHECPHTFEELAKTVLPAHMQRMESALAAPREMKAFSIPGIGAKSLLKKFDLAHDFSGCYVLIDNGVPIYVGISRSVISRLRQHVFGKTHFDASLAFRIAMAKHPDRTISKLTRAAGDGGEQVVLGRGDAVNVCVMLSFACVCFK